MDRDPSELLAPGMFGMEGKPGLRIHAVEREFHALVGAVTSTACALESIAKDIAALRELPKRDSR